MDEHKKWELRMQGKWPAPEWESEIMRCLEERDMAIRLLKEFFPVALASIKRHSRDEGWYERGARWALCVRLPTGNANFAVTPEEEGSALVREIGKSAMTIDTIDSLSRMNAIRKWLKRQSGQSPDFVPYAGSDL